MTLRGCFPVMCTPFGPDGAVHESDFDRVVDFIIGCGADGLVFPGLASEVDTLTAEERAGLVARLGRRAAGMVPFIVGASADTADEVLEHIAAGRAAGASAAMVMAPAVLGDDVSAHQAFFGAVTAGAGLPIMVQNAPAPHGAGLSPDQVARLARLGGVDYVKEETAPCGQNLTRIRLGAGDHIAGVFGGAGGRHIIDELARGSLGTLPAAELADLHVKLVRAWATGNHAEARRIFMVTLPLLNFQAVFRMHMTKEVLRRRGVLSTTHVRGSGPAMDDGDRRELAVLLEAVAPELERNRVAMAEAAE